MQGNNAENRRQGLGGNVLMDGGSKDVCVKGKAGTDWVFFRDPPDTFNIAAGDILDLL